MESRPFGAAAMAEVALVLTGGLAAGATSHCVEPSGAGGCFTTIQAAVDAAGSGTTLISVSPGVFDESVVVPPGKGRVRIEGAGPGATVVRSAGPGAVISVSGPNAGLELSGLSVDGLGTSSEGVASEDVKLSLAECEVRSSTDFGIRVQDAALEVGSCLVEQHGRRGISAAGGSRAEVRDTTVRSIGGGIGSTAAVFLNAKRNLLEASTVEGSEQTGVEAGGRTVIRRSTVSGNGGVGIAASSGQRLQIFQSTVSGNAGGGVIVHGDVGGKIVASTITDNASSEGAGITRGAGCGPQRRLLKVQTSIVAANAGPDCVTSSACSISSRGFNLFESTVGCAIDGKTSLDLVGVDPLLGPLQDNGGPTETHELQPGSPASSAIPVRSLCRMPDQRGIARSTPCDIGSFERP
jgi:hypothetical protein